jgi:lipopolysaccharide biosynthesis regulator YciM
MNVKAIMKMSEVLQMPLESFVKGDETLRLAYVLADPKNGKHEAKLTELARIIEQDREYLIITISGLIEQVQEKDKQIEAFLKALSQKDQIISDYLSLLQMMSKTEMTIEKRKNGDRKPVVYKSEEEII